MLTGDASAVYPDEDEEVLWRDEQTLGLPLDSSGRWVHGVGVCWQYRIWLLTIVTSKSQKKSFLHHFTLFRMKE